MIPYGRQNISQADIDAVIEVLRSDFLTQGPAVQRFEEAVGRYCGAKHSVAVNSATSALHIACLAMGLGPGDILWTSPVTFVASANCALYCGARIDFVDIDPRTYNISIEHLSAKLEKANLSGTLPKVVVPVHFAGQPCDMEAIHRLGRQYGFKIIEDASHAIGAHYLEKDTIYEDLAVDGNLATNQMSEIKIGSCKHSDITVFSFHPVKIITAGEGGVATTNDAELSRRMRNLRAHGITNDRNFMKPRSEHEIWNYQQIELGFNYRMTDIQAALGLSQLERLDDFVKIRHKIALRYDEALKNLPLTTPWQAPGTYSSFHLYTVKVHDFKYNKSQRRIYEDMLKNEIFVNIHYIPVHLQPYYQNLGFKIGQFKEAERYFLEAMSIPIFPTLRSEQQDYVINCLTEVLT